MAPIVPDPKKIKSFTNQAAFAAWLGKNHARETEIWLKVYKKNSGVAMPAVPAWRPEPIAAYEVLRQRRNS